MYPRSLTLRGNVALDPPDSMDLRALWQLAWTTQRATYTTHCHGIDHWVRVERNGLWIASQLGEEVDELVIRLFAAFHDCQRRHDGGDRDHGPRAADFVAGLALPLSELRLEMLTTAIRTHTRGPRSDDPTIQVCHDADRLDLGRVGVKPVARFCSTLPAMELAGFDSVEDLDNLRLGVTCPEWLRPTPRWDGEKAGRRRPLGKPSSENPDSARRESPRSAGRVRSP